MLCLMLDKEPSQSPIPLTSPHLGSLHSFVKCPRSDNGLIDPRNSRASIQRSSNGSNKCNNRLSNRHNNRLNNRLSNRHSDRHNNSI